MSPAVEKYDKRAREIDSLVCVGLDCELSKIPQRFQFLPNPQFEFNKYIIDETHEFASAYKPNTAFYEARGDQGIKELKMTLDYLQEKHPTIFTILDAKRADIGNTNNGYVEFAFNWLGADSITLHPYLGREALTPFLTREDKCSIVLAKTSNPGSDEFQAVVVNEGGEPLWQHISRRIKEEWNSAENLMLVLGATYPEELKVARGIMGDVTFLIPGIGAQGGDVEATVKAGQNSDGRGMIINSSRGIIFSENPKEEARKLRDEIRKYQRKN